MPLAFPKIRVIAKNLTKTFAVITLGSVVALHSTVADAEANPRYAAFVIDANNGKVLFQENADASRFPASLTKMMTLYLMFEAMEQGRATKSTPMKVSAYAAGRPPTKLNLKVGSTLSVEEAILGLVTRSANDASVVIAEFLGGTETQFAEMMTRKARQLGMSHTTFRNANGLPNSEQVTTARDMGTLGIALREHFPQYYDYFDTRVFSFRGQKITGHNRVLGRLKGADGIKTGYTNASGSNLVTSVVRGNRKLVAVVLGGRSARSRDDHMVELVEKYFPQTSSGSGSPLVASYSPSARGGAVARHASILPSDVPLPTGRRTVVNEANIDARVAAAYGSNAANAVEAITMPSNRPVEGRDAIRIALDRQQIGNTSLAIPTANALAATKRTPPARIPNVPQSAIASRAATISPWVVQIAATPVQATAMDMLNEAKQRVGTALAGAEAFTETFNTGSQTLYRARFAGFSSKSEANEACEALKSRAYACYAIAAN